jgi:hypothetical protein
MYTVFSFPGPPHAGAGVEYEGAHAVQVVGYDNTKQAWLIKNTWGEEFAMEGYAWISFNAPGMCDPDTTYGFIFTPKQPTAGLQKPKLSPAPGRPDCGTCRAQAGDYPELLASVYGVPLQQLLLDNLNVIKDPSTVPAGATVLVCGAKLPGLTITTTTSTATATTTTITAGPSIEPAMPCPKLLYPVCYRGVEYPNICIAGSKNPGMKDADAKQGPCPKACLCAIEYRPVCYGGKTYGNLCMASCQNPALKSTDVTPGRCDDSGGVPATSVPTITPTTPPVPQFVCPSSSGDQVAALLAVKAMLDPPGVALTDWVAGSSDPCSWTGISCDGSQRVTAIDFYDMTQFKPKVQLSGQLPAGTLLCKLPALSLLRFEYSGLRGTLPSDWSLLSNLEVLDLTEKEVSGECPGHMRAPQYGNSCRLGACC